MRIQACARRWLARRLAASLRRRQQNARRAAALLESRAKAVLGPTLASRIFSRGAPRFLAFADSMQEENSLSLTAITCR